MGSDPSAAVFYGVPVWDEAAAELLYELVDYQEVGQKFKLVPIGKSHIGPSCGLALYVQKTAALYCTPFNIDDAIQIAHIPAPGWDDKLRLILKEVKKNLDYTDMEMANEQNFGRPGWYLAASYG